jgi:hypothetical protein
LAEFSAIGRLLTLDSLLENYRSSPPFCVFHTRLSFWHKFWQKWVWLHFWQFFKIKCGHPAGNVSRLIQENKFLQLSKYYFLLVA